jgi:TolA-binding protein
MGTVTYPDARVIAHVNERFVPCKLESAKFTDVARRMNARWLPGLAVVDADERPAHVQVGFLPPDDLITELTFGRGIVAMGEKRYADADACFLAVTATPGAERAPEAWFWLGISRYRASKKFSDCQDAWREIVARWPDTLWSRKVDYALEIRL